MSLFLYLFGGGAFSLTLGGLVRLLGGGRRLAFRVCRVVASIATGLPLVMLACAFLCQNADEGGRSNGMLAVAALGMLPASLSCWAATWMFREPAVPPPSELDPGLNRESPER